MKRNKKKPATTRRPGAQQGNTNALKHGFYAKQFTKDENARLVTTDKMSVESEIDLIRICLDRLLNELSFDEITCTDQQGNQFRDDHYLKQLNTLTLMSQSLATLIRTTYLTRGKGGQLEQGIMEALEELRLELGL